MLVGKRRRMLRYLERLTSSATAPWSKNSACGDDRRRGTGPRLHSSQPGRRKGLARRLPRPQGDAGLLPGRLQPRLLATSSRSTRRSSREIDEKGVELVGISVDSFFAHKAFQEKLGFDTTLLSDFEPKGEVSRAYGSYIEESAPPTAPLSSSTRTGTVAWTYESPNPGEFPGANVIFDALA